MSWNGPTVGGPSFQQPFTHGQPGYNHQQPYQYGQATNHAQWQGAPPFSQNGAHQGPPDNRPPKKKGNPIITRYAPPPGYRGPAQPHTPYGQAPYQNHYQGPPQNFPQGYAPNPPTPGYPQGPPAYPPTQGYPQQGYGQAPQNYTQSPTYPQAGYQPGQSHQQSSPSYPHPPQGYSQPPNYGQAPTYPGTQGYQGQPNTYQGYQPQAAPLGPVQQPYPQQQGWQQPNGQAQYPPPEHYNAYNGQPPHHMQDPNATPTPTSANLATSQEIPATHPTASSASESNEKPQLYLAWDDWDFDFEGAIWPKSNEPVDPHLSLGVIIWRPGKQVTRALPCTFAEAEEQALRPPPEKLGNGESVSMYFTLDNSHEAFLDVRQTDGWNEIKDDPVFVVFPDDKDVKLISLDECLAKRDRPDDIIEDVRRDSDQEMQDVSWSVMDNLEQALAGHESNAKHLPSGVRHEDSKARSQEEVLAMLGVTGSPKPPSNEPLAFPFPHFNESRAEPSRERPADVVVHSTSIQSRPDISQQRAHSYNGHRSATYEAPTQRPYGSLSTSTQNTRHDHNPWNAPGSHNHRNSHPFDSTRGSPARSEGSNKTLAGSDFEADKTTHGSDPGSASVPTLERSDSSVSRKRSYDDSDQNDEKIRQPDDHSKRKRRSEVAAAYSRR